MDIRTKIVKLLKSDITSYRIEQLTGISRSAISGLRNDTIKIDNITLVNAERLSGLYDDLNAKKAT